MKYYHVVDHDGFGTMHMLIKDLCDKYNNHILVDRNSIKEIMTNEKSGEFVIIVHTSGGGNARLLYSIEKFLNTKIYIFMHTSYNYQVYKKRDDLIKMLIILSKSKNIKILVPSKEVAKQYSDNGIKCQTIQLGIKKINNDNKYYEYRDDLKEYYDRIVTTCSSYKEQYRYIKGIDLFEDFVSRNDLCKKSIILGISSYNKYNILSKKLNQDDFLNVLCHAKLYVQFSRFESYNITAIQAKQLKVPVILLNAEGNNSCMKGYVYKTIGETEKSIISLLNGKKNFELIEKLYNDSINRENLEKFKETLEEVM